MGETDEPQGRAAADLAQAELLALHHDQRCLTEGAATTCHRQGEAVALPRLVQVDLTDAASCGVDAAGAVWCWGQNAGNVLGSGAPLFDPTPARVAEGATALVAVHGATCIVRDGAWHCTGDGVSSFRELGPAFGGVGSSQYTVFGADGGGLRALASWGTEAEVERLAAPVSGATVAVGDRGTTLYAGGPGGLHAAYSLGEGGQTGWVAMALPPDFGPVAGLASPAVGVCARSAEGAVACWRDDRFDRDDDFVDAPKRTQRLEPVAGLAGAAQLACSQDTVCARLVDGRVRCLGTVDLGGGGLDSPPVELAGLQGATDLAANSFHLCAVVAGEVRCVGNNGWGQLGRPRQGGEFDSGSATPVGVPLPVPAVEVATGQDHSCARGQDGSVWCWGADHLGQLGRGRPLELRDRAVQVAGSGPATEPPRRARQRRPGGRSPE